MSNLLNRYERNIIKSYPVVDINFKYGNGSYLYDENDVKYLDFTSGIGVNSLGHCNPKIVNAIKNQAEKFLHLSNIYMNENAINVAGKLVALSGMENVFFSNSGAESNEAAIKIARKYSFDKYGLGRGSILSLKNSFHGRTISTLTATGQDKFHKYFYPFPEGFKYCEPNIESFNSTVDESICAIIVEGIQGEGGVNQLDKGFVDYLFEICLKKDILIIFDEVQTGVGRTGAFLYAHKFNKTPDIVTLAKGLGGGVPIGAVLCGKKTKDTLKYGDHGSTFGGNPLVTAVADVVLSEFLNENFLKEINKKSYIFFKELQNIKSDNVVAIKGMGLMIGIEVKGDLNSYVLKARERNLLILTAGKNTLRLLPSLNIKYEEISKGIQILKEIL
ncbi:acetylornithine/succinylornithine family transaminase [uncultured Clostridium sp.]|uniref:acetylornithine/succinylornithine family transaminase n=1 Tax=uncultured Clostridium sp. TaxID=59620 RepID=UPI00260ED4E2|nr:acetylornithine/succinylornithine family transaminase [uncultured Clostridium sp.]